MRLRFIPLVVVPLLCCAGSSAFAAAPMAGKPKSCPRNAELKSRAATVGVRDRGDGLHSLVACIRVTGKRRVLSSWFAEGSSTDEPAPQYWLTGRFAAVNQQSCTVDPSDRVSCTATMRVVDLRTGERRSAVTIADQVSDLVLTRRGSLAMIHRSELITMQGAEVSHLDDAAEQGSLAFAASAGLVYWTSDGTPRSTPLR